MISVAHELTRAGTTFTKLTTHTKEIEGALGR
jgi:hypothetical protein